MKLGPGLDLIETVTLRGLVDVYYMNGQRIARKWPCKPKQPQTEKQKAHWAKVREINKFWHAAPSWWTSWMKTFNAPMGYSWYDIAIGGLWDNNVIRYYSVSPDGPPYTGSWQWVDPEHTQKRWGINIPAPNEYLGMTGAAATRENTSGHIEPIKWIQQGWKHYRGCKRKPRYIADISDYDYTMEPYWESTTCGITVWCGLGDPSPQNVIIGSGRAWYTDRLFVPWSPQMLITDYDYCPPV